MEDSVLLPGSRVSLSPLQAFKKGTAPILQPQGNEFCQQPEGIWSESFPSTLADETTARAEI